MFTTSRPRKPLAWVLALASATLLAGCSSGPVSSTGGAAGGSSPASTGSPTAAASSPDTTPAAASSAPAASSASSPASAPSSASQSPTSSAVPTCSYTALRLSTGRAGAAAGNIYQPVIFTNTGASACALYGYPGVAGLDAAGHQLVQAKRESGFALTTVVLPPGGTASALVHAGDVVVGTATACPADYAGLLVTPPNLTHSTRVSVSLPSCDGLLVRPVVAGSTGM